MPLQSTVLTATAAQSAVHSSLVLVLKINRHVVVGGVHRHGLLRL